MHRVIVGVLGCVAMVAATAAATNIPVTPTKLIVVDKPLVSKAKAVFVVKDAAVTKGAGLDVHQISVRLDIRYANGNAAGAFVVPAGASVDKSPGWLVNKESVAKYVNKTAPDGPTQAKVVVMKPGKVLKLVGKGLGDTPLDILGAGDPMGSVFTAFCVDNAGEVNCHCSEFTGCAWKSIAGGTGAKLACKTGTGDAACSAVVPSCYVDTGLTVIDTCNGLEWEKKETAVNSGMDPSNLHDGDNGYSWAGRCTGPNADLLQNAFCQPSSAAAASCAAQTGGALGCSECGPGEGTCDVAVDPLGGGPSGVPTTIWEWVIQVNASNFAGHADWRLPTSAGDSGFSSGEAPEAESILDPTQGYCGGGAFADPCIDPIFGPTWGNSPYWTATSYAGFDLNIAEAIEYHNATGFNTFGLDKNFGNHVRAVRVSP